MNLGDLPDNSIGGIVRGKKPMMEAPSPLVTNVVAQPALLGTEFMDTRREIRTSITRYNHSLEADRLNKTATGAAKIVTTSQQHLQMIATIMAETGVKDLEKSDRCGAPATAFRRTTSSAGNMLSVRCVSTAWPMSSWRA